VAVDPGSPPLGLPRPRRTCAAGIEPFADLRDTRKTRRPRNPPYRTGIPATPNKDRRTPTLTSNYRRTPGRRLTELSRPGECAGRIWPTGPTRRPHRMQPQARSAGEAGNGRHEPLGRRCEQSGSAPWKSAKTRFCSFSETMPAERGPSGARASRSGRHRSARRSARRVRHRPASCSAALGGIADRS
jgi:hypothetical protein